MTFQTHHKEEELIEWKDWEQQKPEPEPRGREEARCGSTDKIQQS